MIKTIPEELYGKDTTKYKVMEKIVDLTAQKNSNKLELKGLERDLEITRQHSGNFASQVNEYQ